jgi:hypothetical protein
MKPLFKNILKSGLTLLIVGIALAAAAPLAASGLGAIGVLSSEFAAEIAAKASLSNVMYTGAFFGMFGAINAAVTPLVSRIFDGKKLPGSTIVAAQAAKGHAPDLSVTTPDHMAQVASSTHFQDMLAAQQAVAGKSPTIS